MKKHCYILFLIFNILFATNLKAQPFVVRAGVNLSTMLSKDDRGTYSKDYSLSPGLMIGMSKEFRMSETLSLETGLNYSQKGFLLDKDYALYADQEPVRSYYKAVLNYLEMPLAVKYNVIVAKLPVYGLLGPYLGLGLGGKTISDVYSGNKSNRETFFGPMDKNGYWKKFDGGMVAGLGVSIKKFDCRLTYSYGLVNFSRRDPLIQKNRVTGISVGYRFSLN